MGQREHRHGFTYQFRQTNRRPEQKINDLGFADGIALHENSLALATIQLHHLAEPAREVGLEINVNKTEYIAFNISTSEKDKKLLLNNKKPKIV